MSAETNVQPTVAPKIDDFCGEYRWLSNFHLVDVVYEGQAYPSTEHAYQAAKSLDPEVRAGIAELATPREAKQVGQMIAIRPDWEQVKLRVMEDVLRLKFAHPELAKKLAATRGMELIEGNTWGDRFWGVCDGRGENWLGWLLMKIRDEQEAGERGVAMDSFVKSEHPVTGENLYAQVAPETRSETEQEVVCGDSLEVMRQLADESFDAAVTDPPAGIEFMGKAWDKFDEREPNLSGHQTAEWDDSGGADGTRPFARSATPRYQGKNKASLLPFQDFIAETFAEVLRVLKPGGHAIVWALPRTSHHTAMGLERAGFEIRDVITHHYGCLSEDTEVLVDGRWEQYRNAVAGRLALCYDLAHDTYSWQPIEQLFIYDYSDTAFRLSSDHTDQIVSRGHRCLVKHGGGFTFCLAETLEREARVPILEDVQGLLTALPVSHERAGNSQNGVFPRARECAISDGTEGEAAAPHLSKVRGGIRSKIKQVTEYGEVLLNTVCRAGSRVKAWIFGDDAAYCCDRATGMDGSESRKFSCQNERREQSRMEGWCDCFQDARQLLGSTLRALSAIVLSDGTQGWVCDGAPSICRASDRSLPYAGGDSASRESCPDRQQPNQSNAFREQQRSQVVRGSRYTVTDLVRVEAVDYRGKVWCIKVPTGAFVARRNGMVFVTGNSGFPKSLDASKAIDAHLGAERTVVIGEGRWASVRGVSRASSQGASNGGTPGGYNMKEAPHVTAPASDEAKRWAGFGTALKPASENWILARKPLIGTVAANVLEYGTGAMNIDACRIGAADQTTNHARSADGAVSKGIYGDSTAQETHQTAGQALGRWPANLILSHSEDCGQLCTDDCPVAEMDRQSGKVGAKAPVMGTEPSDPVEENSITNPRKRVPGAFHADGGGASRFFYQAKPSRAEREAGCEHLPSVSGAEAVDREEGSAGTKSPRAGAGRTAKKVHNNHPTVKSISLMKWLIRLVARPGATIIDPFGGSGTTGAAAALEGVNCLLIERDPDYVKIIEARLAHWKKEAAKGKK